MMTDPPTDDTEAREQDAPDTTDAKHRAPFHGHTGAVPPDKALSDMHTVQSPPLQAGSCHECRSMKGGGDRGSGEIGERTARTRYHDAPRTQYEPRATNSGPDSRQHAEQSRVHSVSRSAGPDDYKHRAHAGR
eukprot:scaffold9287_cov126-Isochrysis_galbana.AAC.4